MKNITTLIAALLFSSLFYKQQIGINLLFFTLLTIIVLLINNFNAFKNTFTITLSVSYLFTGITVFLYNSNLAIIANLIGFITLIGSYSNSNSSIYIKWVNGIYTTIVSYFSRYFDKLSLEVKLVEKKETNYLYWFKIILIPLITISIFISLYRNANPLFDEIISKIDLSFINFQWLLLASLGYYLFNNISNPIQIEPLTKLDLNQKNSLLKGNLKEVTSKNIENEKQLGVVLMVLLNLLILFLLITDILYLMNHQELKAVELSKQVHAGINSLIVSLLFAILLIIYFFRGNLNFIKNNKLLKNLTFIWIYLNLFLVVSIAFKNSHYISSFGLTYKRIGVFIYLILTLIGLLTTYIKVNKIKNVWFLFRRNTQIAFAILIMSSAINWDSLITFYNINYAEELDMDYLIKLPDNNTFLLKKYMLKNELNYQQNKNIERKYTQYLKRLEAKNWQETTYDNLILKK